MRRRVWHTDLDALLFVLLFSFTTCFTQLDNIAAISPNLQLSWSFRDSNIIVEVQKNRVGYACIGLGSSMSSADILQIQTTGGDLSVQNCILTGYGPPNCNVEQTWTLMDSEIKLSGFRVQLFRTIQAPNSQSKTFGRNVNSLVYAHTDSPSVVQHTPSQPGMAYGVKRVNFQNGDISSPLLSWGDGTYMRHEHSQLILWSIVCDGLILVGRNLKRYNRSSDVHGWAFIAVLLLSFLLRHNKNAASSSPSPATLHRTNATFVLILSGLILLNGCGLKIVMEFWRGLKKVDEIRLIRKVHTALGVTIWLMTRIQLFLGANMLNQRYYAQAPTLYLIIESSVFVLAVLGLELWRARGRMASRVETQPRGIISTHRSAEIVTDINLGLSIPELKRKYPGRNIFIFLDKIYDTGGYVHPGGQLLFEKCRFREVSRFMYGAVGYEENDGARWVHSGDAFAVLANSCIGHLESESAEHHSKDLILLKTEESVPLVSESSSSWQVYRTIPLSQTTSLIQFKPETKSRVKILCRGRDWIGKHYIIASKRKARPYTNCSTLCSEYQVYQSDLIRLASEIILGVPSQAKIKVCQEYIDYLPAVIKQYPGKTALSRVIVESQEGAVFNIAGPIGRGLEIPEHFDGRVVMIAAGTGILPFVDLLDLLFKKLLSEVMVAKKMQDSVILPNQDYSAIFPSATWQLIGSFRTLDDLPCLPLLEALHKMSANFRNKFFSSILEFASTPADFKTSIPLTSEKFDLAFLKENVIAKQEKPPLVLLSATPAMMAEIYKDLVEGLDLPRDNIIFV